MSVIWEDPPTTGGRGARFGTREPSPIRKETQAFKETMRENEGRWARLWDLPTKDEARKRSNYAQGKGFSFSVRETQYGWSVFGRFNGDPEPGTPEQPQPDPQPEPGQPQQPDPETQPVEVSAEANAPTREPTFPE
jgi:hypothetical protein